MSFSIRHACYVHYYANLHIFFESADYYVEIYTFLDVLFMLRDYILCLKLIKPRFSNGILKYVCNIVLLSI